jgi:hypothetical protein
MNEASCRKKKEAITVFLSFRLQRQLVKPFNMKKLLKRMKELIDESLP